MVTTMVERRITITLPDDLSNIAYAALIHCLQGVLYATGLGPRSTIHPDPHISDTELNVSRDQAAECDPWAP